MVADLDVLDRAAVARLIGVEPDTVTNYLNQSRPGGRYERHPFPEPDGRPGGRPLWKGDRADEIRAWAESRPGRGAGGGQPAHRRDEAV
jgi:hypothetical protein